MTPQHWDVWISLVAMLVSGISLWFARRDRDAEGRRAALEALEADFRARTSKLDELGNARYAETSGSLHTVSNRLSRLEESVKQIPTHRDIDVLQQSIALLGQSVAKLEGSVEQNIRSVGRITDYLLDKQP